MRNILFLFVILVLVACGAPKPAPTAGELIKKLEAGDLAAGKELLAFLGEGPDYDTRAKAYVALLKAPKGLDADILAAARSSSDQTLREQAIAMSATRKIDGFFDVALAALNDASFKKSHAAAWALGESGDERAIPHLVEAMIKAKPELMAKESARALVRFGVKSAPFLIAKMPSLSGDTKRFALRALGEFRVPESKAILVANLSDPEYRIDAIGALGTFGREGEPVNIARYLDDPDWKVRIEAARAMGLLFDHSAKKKLDELRKSDPNIVVREWAARSLGLLTEQPENYLTPEGKWKLPDSIYH